MICRNSNKNQSGYNPFYLFPFSKRCYFKSIFQSPFMSRTFLILHRDSAFLLIYLMYCLWKYSIIIPQFTRKYFSNFSNLQRNITSTEHLLILEAVLRRVARFRKAFSTARPSTPKKWFDKWI